MTEEKKRISDVEMNDNWDKLLKIFHSIEENDKKGEDKKQDYAKLIAIAKTKPMNNRQIEGIVDRCNYRIGLINNPKELPFSNAENLLLKK